MNNELTYRYRLKSWILRGMTALTVFCMLLMGWSFADSGSIGEVKEGPAGMF